MKIIGVFRDLFPLRNGQSSINCDNFVEALVVETAKGSLCISL